MYLLPNCAEKESRSLHSNTWAFQQSLHFCSRSLLLHIPPPSPQWRRWSFLFLPACWTAVCFQWWCCCFSLDQELTCSEIGLLFFPPALYLQWVQPLKVTAVHKVTFILRFSRDLGWGRKTFHFSEVCFMVELLLWVRWHHSCVA